MKKVTKLIIGMMLLIPGISFGAGECKVVEFSDHFEVVCVGDGTSEPAQAPAATQRAQRQIQPAQPAVQQPSQVVAQTTSQPKENETNITDRSFKTRSEAMDALIAYRQRQPSKSARDAARATRMRTILAERQNDLNLQKGAVTSEQ